MAVVPHDVQAQIAALVALAGGGGAGAGALVHWAVASAAHPVAQEVALGAARRAAAAAKLAQAALRRSLARLRRRCRSQRRVYCVESWGAAAAAISCVCFAAACAAGGCCLGVACAGGGGALAWRAARLGNGTVPQSAREPSGRARADELIALDALAQEIRQGDLGVRRRAARELGVPVPDLDEWAAQWARLMRGPVPS